MAGNRQAPDMSKLDNVISEIHDTEDVFRRNMQILENAVNAILDGQHNKKGSTELYANLKEMLSAIREINEKQVSDMKNSAEKEAGGMRNIIKGENGNYTIDQEKLSQHMTQVARACAFAEKILSNFSNDSNFAHDAKKAIEAGDLDKLENMDHNQLIIQAAQRMPRYNLLFKDAIKHAPPELAKAFMQADNEVKKQLATYNTKQKTNDEAPLFEQVQKGIDNLERLVSKLPKFNKSRQQWLERIQEAKEAIDQRFYIKANESIMAITDSIGVKRIGKQKQSIKDESENLTTKIISRQEEYTKEVEARSSSPEEQTKDISDLQAKSEKGLEDAERNTADELDTTSTSDTPDDTQSNALFSEAEITDDSDYTDKTSAEFDYDDDDIEEYDDEADLDVDKLSQSLRDMYGDDSTEPEADADIENYTEPEIDYDEDFPYEEELNEIEDEMDIDKLVDALKKHRDKNEPETQAEPEAEPINNPGPEASSADKENTTAQAITPEADKTKQEAKRRMLKDAISGASNSIQQQRERQQKIRKEQVDFKQSINDSTIPPAPPPPPVTSTVQITPKPPKGMQRAERNKSHLNPKYKHSIKQFLSDKGWSVPETSDDIRKTQPFQVTNGEEKFTVSINKITTDSSNLETFKIMLETFKEAHKDDGLKPQVQTDNQELAQKWSQAYKQVYGNNAPEMNVTVKAANDANFKAEQEAGTPNSRP